MRDGEVRRVRMVRGKVGRYAEEGGWLVSQRERERGRSWGGFRVRKTTSSEKASEV